MTRKSNGITSYSLEEIWEKLANVLLRLLHLILWKVAIPKADIPSSSLPIPLDFKAAAAS